MKNEGIKLDIEGINEGIKKILQKMEAIKVGDK